MTKEVQETIRDEMKEVLKQRINERIEKLGITQKDIAAGTGIDQRNLTNLLKNPGGGLNQLFRVAQYLQVPIDDDELELETIYWIKRRGEFKSYLLNKIKEGIKNDIRNHLDLIRYTYRRFEDDFNLLEKKQEVTKEGEWSKIQEDALKVITKLVFATFDLKIATDLNPITVQRKFVNDEYHFFYKSELDRKAKGLVSVNVFVYESFKKKYGAQFFYEEVIVKSVPLNQGEYVQDVVDTNNGTVLWMNPYC